MKQTLAKLHISTLEAIHDGIKSWMTSKFNSLHLNMNDIKLDGKGAYKFGSSCSVFNHRHYDMPFHRDYSFLKKLGWKGEQYDFSGILGQKFLYFVHENKKQYLEVTNYPGAEAIASEGRISFRLITKGYTGKKFKLQAWQLGVSEKAEAIVINKKKYSMTTYLVIPKSNI